MECNILFIAVTLVVATCTVVSGKELANGCVDCRLVRVPCTDELRDQQCSRCSLGEVCCDNCCSGSSCNPTPVLPVECIDCTLSRFICTDEQRDQRCDSCSLAEVCCDNCCGGRKCVPRQVKQGRCPPQQLRPCTTGIDDVKGCDFDGQCDGSQKCCPGGCAVNTCQVATTDVEICLGKGLEIVNCFANPCDVEHCAAFPDAECESNYCGGCNADWFVDGEPVDCAVEPCPGDLELVYCLVNPCDNAICSAFPDADCVPNYCGDCNTEWFVGGKLVDCAADMCPDGSQPVNCFVDPCRFATCSKYPEARCVSNFCGGCNAVWKLNGNPVNCDQNICELSLDPGPCEAIINRFGYANGRCIAFTYGGCDGNDNNFSSKEECRRACKSPCVNCDLILVKCSVEAAENTCGNCPDCRCCDNCCGGEYCADIQTDRQTDRRADRRADRRTNRRENACGDRRDNKRANRRANRN